MLPYIEWNTRFGLLDSYWSAGGSSAPAVMLTSFSIAIPVVTSVTPFSKDWKQS